MYTMYAHLDELIKLLNLLVNETASVFKPFTLHHVYSEVMQKWWRED